MTLHPRYRRELSRIVADQSLMRRRGRRLRKARAFLYIHGPAVQVLVFFAFCMALVGIGILNL
jgi:hypothetical protein